MSERRVKRIQLVPREGAATGERIRARIAHDLGVATGRIWVTRLLVVLDPPADEVLEACARAALCDPIVHDLRLDDVFQPPDFATYLLISRQPGVTDDEGMSAQRVIDDFGGAPVAEQRVFSQELFYFEKPLADADLRRIATELLGNPLVHHFEWGRPAEFRGYVPAVSLTTEAVVEQVPVNLDDGALLDLSRTRLLSLNLEEMRAVKAHFLSPETMAERTRRGLPTVPTDCELEVIAQTWSEHCKHKEFNATIHFRDLDTGRERTVHSLFKTFIRGSTEIISSRLSESGNNWLVKVFSDNAGIVRLDAENDFVWKVETHNSPSALDPYGGAITGILGNNRDAFGTGRGGAELLFNTDVLCFGPADYSGPLSPGQIHPRRIMQGVVHGIEDGGNKSGVPTVNGSVIFDERFAGKPLVFCGTGAIMRAGGDRKDKPIHVGDRIVMAGGRVGKDGIHGATFSSVELDDNSPRSAVQIGSPITQKILYDFLREAVALDLVRSCTDNGAGGLSSSIGELATITKGAVVNLEQVPLKYSGLRPWEIFVSESQERMSLVVAAERWDELRTLAARHEVELSDIGEFTDTGYLDVRYAGDSVAFLSLEFLHDGVPHKVMEAEWKRPEAVEPIGFPVGTDFGPVLLKLLASPNICSREAIIRRFDHEVKGRTIVKPLMGPAGFAPQDAAVVRVNFESWLGVAVSNGIAPKFGDLDPYEMSAGAFDEAVRGIIAVGGRLPDPADPAAPSWSVNDNFCVPDSQYDPVGNPDGRLKLGKLVRMAEALYDMAVTFNIPMTSGKDSMKNDFRGVQGKISVPPTILYSMVARIDDVRRTVTSYFKKTGDVVYLLGETYDELGASEYYRLFGWLGANVPRVRPQQAMALYRKVSAARDWLASCHDLSDGGLAVALAECCFGGGRGVNVVLPALGLAPHQMLFSESHSRFVCSVPAEHAAEFERHMGALAIRLGEVSAEERVAVRGADGGLLIDVAVADTLKAWRTGLAL